MSDRILIVDDEAEIADLIEVYLSNENFTVFKFYSAYFGYYAAGDRRIYFVPEDSFQTYLSDHNADSEG